MSYPHFPPFPPPQLVATACLYLAGKVVDSPKSARDVLFACFEHRFASDPEAVRCRLLDREYVEAARGRIFLAERAILYAVAFDLVCPLPYEPLFRFLSEPSIRLAW